ncbi:DUF4974 domain-containing protein [Arenibacter sp. F26102]|uniref:FecR family protein n=1 Tax=Arenibacter sp. F26102 TaxID=2926416 RepID=UPI001FF3205D|nr:FecR domain-containing protein [Arenibacter sp. F26102]MCK0146496.1 DUF4974 domain-containing protein [Arenibacter sp. F26102]
MKKSITKLLLGTLTEKEIIEFKKWLKDPSNQAVLEAYVRDYHDLNLATIENNLDEAYNKICLQIDKTEKPVRRLLPNWTKYAALIVLLIGLGLFYQQGFFSSQNQVVIVPKDDSIILELGNGTIQVVHVDGIKEVKDSEGNIVYVQRQDQISYSQVTKKKELVFNTLKTPNGKKFQVELSDGTLVFLNAGSSLKYPVNFLSEGPRQVFLTGEAYFDVTTNESNPFIVNVDELDVKVLGTEFNISAYGEDEHIDVVLVKGAVDLNKKERLQEGAVELSPGQKGTFYQDSMGITVDDVNTSLYTSWMQGKIIFNDLTFKVILKKLERHYNIEIVNTNAEIENEVFHASFDNVDIGEVLGYFNDIHNIDFKIKGNRVIIK